jgi:phosphoribosylformylglycinamidine synthase
MAKYAVQILPREVILDTQGRAVEQTLKLQNLTVQSCVVGKYIELVLEESGEQGLNKAKSIAEKVLCNPLIEKFTVRALAEVQV